MVYFFQETFPRNKQLPLLFTPLTIRGVTFANRIFVVSNFGGCFACSARTDECSYFVASISPCSLSHRCASTAQTTAMRRTGTSCTSAYVPFLPSLRYQWATLTGYSVCGLCRTNRDSRRVVPAGSSWKQPRSCRRAASPQRTQVSGRTRRSRRSSGSSTLCTFRGPRLAFSSRMRVARLRHLPRGSSRARIASIVRIPRLPLLTRVDGLTTVRHSTFPTPIAAPVSRYFAVH
jgi:hypothetical protein